MSRRVVLFPAVLAVVSLVLSAPSDPAHWSGLLHFGQLRSGGTGELGVVVVDRCSQSLPLLGWSCSGTFSVNDPMAEPFPPTTDVRVANDWHQHHQGARIDTEKEPRSHVGYLWGASVQAATAVWAAGVLLCLLAVLLTGWARRRRRHAAAVGLWVSAVLGLLLITASGSL